MKLQTKEMTMLGIFTALLCVLAPLAIPLPGLVPISLTNLVLYFTIYLLDWKKSALCYLVYLAIGAIGLPVFSGYGAGLAKLVGPTGGYLLGFLPMVIVAGWVVDHFPHSRVLQLGGMVVGTGICYLFGTLWLAKVAGLTFEKALFAGVIPFLPGDFAKILAASAAAPILQRRLDAAGLLAAPKAAH